jgi:hypothetical protein
VQDSVPETPPKRKTTMPKFEPGESVSVPATIQQGAFPGEHLVTVQTATGPVSGFVRTRDIVTPNQAILAVVQESTPANLKVILSGSYFTTTGLAEFAADWAVRNVKVIA